MRERCAWANCIAKGPSIHASSRGKSLYAGRQVSFLCRAKRIEASLIRGAVSIAVLFFELVRAHITLEKSRRLRLGIQRTEPSGQPLSLRESARHQQDSRSYDEKGQSRKQPSSE